MTTIESPAVGSVSAGAGLAIVAEWVTSTDHKRIGRLYLGTATVGLAISTVVAALLSLERIDITRELVDLGALTQLFSLARVGLLYLAVLPAMVGLGVAVVPLQVGARSLTFPRVAAGGYWLWLAGAILSVYSLILNGGPGGGNPRFVDLFMLSMVLVIVGLLAGALSVAATVLTNRAPGMNLRRVPLFAWASLVMALTLIVSLPVVGGDLVILYLAHAYPSLSPLSGNRAISEWVAFGFTQPTTLLFVLPALGAAADVVATATRRRTASRGVMLAGLGLAGTAVFAPVLQDAVTVPTGFGDRSLGDKLADLLPYAIVHLLPLLGVFVVVALLARSLRSRPTLGGPLVGAVGASLLLLLAAAANALAHLDGLGLGGTAFEEGTWLAVVYAGVLAVVSGVGHWGPKWWGRRQPTVPGVMLALSGLAGGVLASLPMLLAGVLDQPGAVLPVVERGADAVVYFPDADGPLGLLNALTMIGHLLIVVTVVGAVALTWRTARTGTVAGDDPWDGQTLEWATPSPAPFDNFAEVHVVRSPEPLADLKSSRSDT